MHGVPLLAIVRRSAIARERCDNSGILDRYMSNKLLTVIVKLRLYISGERATPKHETSAPTVVSALGKVWREFGCLVVRARWLMHQVVARRNAASRGVPDHVDVDSVLAVRRRVMEKDRPERERDANQERHRTGASESRAAKPGVVVSVL
jgi:hypothetical protein